MRIVSRTARSVREQERENAVRKREAAGTLATAYPGSELVRIHLKFVSRNCPEPAARTHDLYPSAHAYFEFACPYGDCDGSIDLNAAVIALLRTTSTHADGILHCPGTRIGPGGARLRCNQRVDYWIAVRHQALARVGIDVSAVRTAHKCTKPIP